MTNKESIEYRWIWRDDDYDIQQPYNKCPHCGEFQLVMVREYNMEKKHWWSFRKERNNLKNEYFKCRHCGYYKKLKDYD